MPGAYVCVCVFGGWGDVQAPDTFPSPRLIPPATEAWEVSWAVDWGRQGLGPGPAFLPG